MKILSLAHTYYMLLVLSQLKETVYKGDDMDVIFTDDCTGSEAVFLRLREARIFRNCYYFESAKTLFSQDEGNVSKFINLITLAGLGRKVPQTLGLEEIGFHYDAFLCYVVGRAEEQILFNEIIKRNPHAHCELFEEGYVSYFASKGILSVEKIKRLSWIGLLPPIMTLSGKKRWLIERHVSCAWCFDPALVQYRADFEIRQIPKFDSGNRTLLDKLNDVFRYDASTFSADYIFLEDSFYMNHDAYGDLELVKKIYRSCRERGEFLVKLHPRTRDNRFRPLHIPTNQVNLPLELVALNGAKDTTFFTVASGAPLSCLLCAGMSHKIVMLYKFSPGLPDTVTNPQFREFVETMRARYPEQIFIPESESELDKILETL